ncbi:MarR family transcriptional regulator [Mycobacterium sp. UM_Kg1]|uniref:MarR family winged helix-turn-helix transcriptional regulator n=1 Tax=Mycobacterium sp. UM_Kg1 TaxID=1545691 RepID=UPI000AF36DE7|nr:MarR family transcriptional regulator [Mycobacterium sp. UM_Kg1]
MPLPDEVYARLLAFRTRLRRFERWSADQAQAAGLTPAQHQLLLAVRGHSDPRGPTVGDIAEYLLLRHHSAGELIQRAESAGLVTRVRDSEDQRVIRLQLTETAAQCLQALTELHLKELERFSAESPLGL